MHATAYQRLDPVLPDGDAMLRLAEAVGEYEAHDVEPVADASGPCFREIYASDSVQTSDPPGVPGIEPLLHHGGLTEAARRIHGRPLVRPARVYASLLVPGQEQAVHTDVPEFRGLHAAKDPPWLLVAMHHSGLFANWRVRIATAVSWFGPRGDGGAFCFYPDGPYGQPVAVPARHNTGIALDTDSVFHGVDRLPEEGAALPRPGPGAQLRFAGDGRWTLHDPESDTTRAEYTWNDLHFSITWKARCYADADEERAARDHTDDLTRERATERLCEDLRGRGRLGDAYPDDAELARAAREAYVPFPPRPLQPAAPT